MRRSFRLQITDLSLSQSYVKAGPSTVTIESDYFEPVFEISTNTDELLEGETLTITVSIDKPLPNDIIGWLQFAPSDPSTTFTINFHFVVELSCCRFELMAGETNTTLKLLSIVDKQLKNNPTKFKISLSDLFISDIPIFVSDIASTQMTLNEIMRRGKVNTPSNSVVGEPIERHPQNSPPYLCSEKKISELELEDAFKNKEDTFDLYQPEI